MVYTIEEIKERIRPVAEKYNLPAVYLFGSYARGEADEKSDIDIMIDRTGTPVVGLIKLSGVFLDLEESLSKGIDMVTTDVFSQKKGIDFSTQLRQDMVKIYDRKI